MFNSMTAFGRSRMTVGGRDITVEIRSVNNRYLDCGIKLPHSLSAVEERIKPYIQSKGISRGKVDIYVSVEEVGDRNADIMLDESYASAYISALKELRDKFSLPDDITTMRVSQNRDIFRSCAVEEDAEKDWAELAPVLDEALDSFLSARAREGQKLYEDICGKIDNLRVNVEKIRALSENDIASYRDKIEERIRQILSDNRITVDENRILTECAIAADKLAIDEETVRLGSHFDGFVEIAGSNEPAGRKLDFLIQEMNREVNTIGSKCQNASIARIVVDCKSEIEKIREQIQNIE